MTAVDAIATRDQEQFVASRSPAVGSTIATEGYYIEMITISVKLPESTDAHLTAAAKRRGRSKSALIREALDAHLIRQGRRERSSCLDLARDLAGCVRGPADLATHPRHMRRYGQ